MADRLAGGFDDYPDPNGADVLPSALSGMDWILVLLSTLAVLLVLVSSS
jgi:hypothetical protein